MRFRGGSGGYGMKAVRKHINRISDYIYDSSVDIKERTFMVVSCSVLVALFLAVPFGIIMREPVSATISTIVGAVFFSVYVIWAFKRNKIEQAKTVISLILVFVFLPAMLFTNGGVHGGAPIWLLLGTIYIAMILEGRMKIFMLICETVVLITTWIVSYLFPSLTTEYSRGGNYFDTFAGLLVVSGVVYAIISFQNNLYRKEEERKNVQRLFAQTAMALVNAIDKKDRYTHGHSARVAEYSRKIAEAAGKSPRECEEIYYVALLHDVGKIGIPEQIINKEGRLTDSEFDTINQHPSMGAQILQSITEYPYLSIGALYHHERYDGNGYPHKLKGNDIPEVARIISVADAYDAMTSNRSYREPIPQQKVREEYIKCAGTQFDPEFAAIMVHLIDSDIKYKMREKNPVGEPTIDDMLVVNEHRDDVSRGIHITPFMSTIGIKVHSDNNTAHHKPRPSMILFDSLDERYHDEEREITDLNYYEFCEIFLDGEVVNAGARNTRTKITPNPSSPLSPGRYLIDAVKVKDHALIKITTSDKTIEVTVALPDSSRYLYIGFTGEHCRITDMTITKSDVRTAPEDIPRIAEEISYIKGPAGDIPNLQVDGYRTESTRGIEICDGLKITFHSQSLPTARLVWHCPSFAIFSSDNALVNGENYSEFALVRVDGEIWKPKDTAVNKSDIKRADLYAWDEWKKFNKKGYDCTVTFSRDGNKITCHTENAGISITNETEITVDVDKVYVALSGDQCALTNIRISKPE